MFYRMMEHQFNVKVVLLLVYTYLCLMFEFEICKCLYASFIVLVTTIPKSSRNGHKFHIENYLTCTYIFVSFL